MSSSPPPPLPQGQQTFFSFRNSSWLIVALVATAVATFMREPTLWRGIRNIFETSSAATDCVDAHQYLTDVMPVKGFHVLCIKPTTSDTLKVSGFKNGNFASESVETPLDWESFSHTVEDELLETPKPSDEHARKYQQLIAYFTPDGVRLEKNVTLLQDHQIVFVFEGGQFIWPGIRVGHKAVVENAFGRGDLVLETISMTPLVFSVEEFLWDNEIDVILELSMPHLAPSGVALEDGNENKPATTWRTSTTYWLDSSAHSVVQGIDKRTADLVKVPVSHQESVQVLRYEPTQHYDQHVDYFAADRYQNSPDLLEKIEYGYNNRMITVFWYMSDVAKGGHTNFARAGGLPYPPSNKGCTQGLNVVPKKGKVIVFYSMLPNGENDPMSLHAGCPVEEGIKLSGNKWIWNKPQGVATE
uniref:Fe2OG dioxygenase domain-containing protein n=1 Tax=Hyaloperonospora arabidopsidis (strain Emoy2) TaxID=559515 RepID=M4BLF7_HYAAE